MVSSEEPGDDRRGARAEASGEGDLAAHAEGDAVCGTQALEGTDDQVFPADGELRLFDVERELARLLDLELEPEGDRRRHHVVARPQVRRGGGDADQSAPRGHSANTARSTALRSFSQLTTGGAFESAVSGSLRPWPVSTQTTLSGTSAPSTTGSPWARRPATDAAEAGSQKTPSLPASQW